MLELVIHSTIIIFIVKSKLDLMINKDVSDVSYKVSL